MRTVFAVAVSLAMAGAACGNFLSLSEEDTPANPDASSDGASQADGLVDGDPGTTDGASASSDGATNDGPSSDASNDGGTNADASCALTCDSKVCQVDGGCDPLVFITTNEFMGALAPGVGSGVAKGDDLCMKARDAAGLKGTYQAWLSGFAGDPSQRFQKKSTRPYRRRDTQIVAANFDGLKSPSLLLPILLDQAGSLVPPLTPVWTGTTKEGQASVARCGDGLEDWKFDATAGSNGFTGRAGSSDFEWTAAGNASCSLVMARLYCVEQQP